MSDLVVERVGKLEDLAPGTARKVVVGGHPIALIRIDDEELAGRPTLLRHEGRHATQYACCLGVVMLPLYGLAATWSWLRCRDPSSYNVFEVRAGLEDGGYLDRRRPAGDSRVA